MGASRFFDQLSRLHDWCQNIVKILWCIWYFMVLGCLLRLCDTRLMYVTSQACIVYRLGKLNIASCIAKLTTYWTWSLLVNIDNNGNVKNENKTDGKSGKHQCFPFYSILPTNTTPGQAPGHCLTKIPEVRLSSDPGIDFNWPRSDTNHTSAILIGCPFLLSLFIPNGSDDYHTSVILVVFLFACIMYWLVYHNTFGTFCIAYRLVYLYTFGVSTCVLTWQEILDIAQP